MDAVDMLQGRRPILPYSIVLTFDDGYRNNLTHAWPILRQYKAPATFFVPTGFLDNPRPFWWDRLDYALQQAQTNGRDMTIGSVTVRLDYSSRDTLRESYKRLRRAAKEQRMSDLEFLRQVESIYTQLEKESGKKLSDIQKNDGWSAILSWKHVETFGDEDVAFGSHTVDHIRLGLVDLDVVYDQLEKSKRDIETHTGKPCLSLCYPSGSFTERTVDLAEKCGYLCGVTTMEGLNHIGDNVMTLRRIDLPVNVACRDLLFRLSVTGS
jgi:peptidoglycan/xylan/chitin deacetylase (PgdA/CDA1 family)